MKRIFFLALLSALSGTLFGQNKKKPRTDESVQRLDSVFFKNEWLYLAAQTEKDEFLIVEIPETEPRFFVFPSEDKKAFYITFIDDILKYNLQQEFSKKKEVAFYSFKIKVFTDSVFKIS